VLNICRRVSCCSHFYFKCARCLLLSLAPLLSSGLAALIFALLALAFRLAGLTAAKHSNS
jgi:hypothetical protein